jgi:hypothetical protein
MLCRRLQQYEFTASEVRAGAGSTAALANERRAHADKAMLNVHPNKYILSDVLSCYF